MNRPTPQNDDLRRMQQEAMRRVQEMQNRSQSYVRSGERFSQSSTDERNTSARSNDNTEVTEQRYTQSRSTTQRTRQPQKIPPVIQNVESEANGSACGSDIPPEPDNCEYQNNCPNTSAADDCREETNICKNDCSKQSCCGNDMVLILLILLLASNGNRNDSILLAALIFLLI